MTEHAACYETITARHPGAAGNRVDKTFSQLMTNIALTGDTAYLVPYPWIPPSGYNVVPCAEVTLFESGDSEIYTKAFANLSQVIQDGASVDNNSAFVKRGTGAVSAHNSGRIGARLFMDFDEALEPDNPTALYGMLHYAHLNENYSGLQHFVEFEDFPPGSQTDADPALTRILNQFNQSTSQYTLGLDASGNPVTMNNCGYAALAPEGAVYVRPEDIGAGADQIPNDTVDNTAAKFRLHPSVFYPAGKAGYVRGVTRQAIDNIEVNSQVAAANGGPIGITTVDQAPTSSNWLVSVDGQFQVVQLAHPAGSDYRRPRDIWNNVWVPILQGGSNVGAAELFEGGNNTGGSIAFRWDYADYFRCLPLAGSNVFQDIPG